MSSPRTRQLPPVRSVSYLPIFHFFFSIFFLALFCARTAFALDPSLDISQYAHTSWKVRDGFVKGTITSITQTPDGYLWLGTTFGLYRFDGVRAVPWESPAGQQLPSNIIGNLLVARDGTLWISTLKGLASWKDSKLTQYPEVAGHMVSQLLQDREGTVWVAVSGPGSLCAVQGEKLRCYGAGSFGNYTLAPYEDREGNLWVWATTGLWRWKPGLPKQYGFARPTEVDSLIEDDTGALLLASDDGLKQLASGKIQSYALPSVTGKFRPTRFLRSSDGSLWIGSRQGLFHLHQGKTDLFVGADGLSGDFVGSIFEDREGDVWVGTSGGLDRFRDFTVRRISRDQGLSTNDAYSLQATQDGAIWIGSSDGLNRWKNGHVTVYTSRSTRGLGGRREVRELKIGGAVTEVANSGSEGTPRSLGLDDQGRLWISTSDGVFFFDGARFIRVPGVQGDNAFPGIAGDGHGKVWITDATLGLFYLTPGESPKPIPWSQFGQKNFGAQSLLPDRSDGGLWLGFLEGGIAYVKDGRVRTSYTVADGLGKGRVDHLRFGSRGALWAATEGGLSRIKDGHIETLSSKNGLPCDAVHWSVEDDDHAMWVYTPCGLARIERSEWYAWVDDPRHVIETITFDSSDGVPSIGFYGGYGPHVTKSSDGRIWFVTGDGVSVIDPRHLPYNKLSPPVHIEQVTADGKVYDAANGVQLPRLVRYADIDYTALSLVVPEKVRFRVKLEGQDKDWRELVNVRHVEYTNLAPKTYRFLVKACNNSGVWNEDGTALTFIIPPMWYQTNWFLALCVAAFLALLWALYQYRLHQMAAQFNMRLEERVGERTRIARDLHDTLLQSFHGVLLYFQTGINLLPERPAEPRTAEARKTLEKAILQARHAIVEGREAIQGLRSSVVETNDLALAMRTLGEELAANSNSTAFEVHVEGTPRDLHPILRDEVYRITGEGIRNAFRHADAKQIEVEIHYDDKRLRVRVRDDGKGIEPKLLSDEGREGHFGLRGMRERASLIGGKLTVWSELDAGTEMELSIPASRAYTTATDGQQMSLTGKLLAKLSGRGKVKKP